MKTPLLRLGLVACLLLLGATACQAPPSPAECERLLERYTEKLIERNRPSASAGEHARLVNETRELAARDPQFARCSLELSRSQWECAMAAHTADAIERCLL